jgi:site-specific DNA-methyltransferase (adenine-specific)
MSGIIEECTLGPCRLILGDCREVLPLLERVDAVVTDPPYGIEFTGKHAYMGHKKKNTTFRPGSYSHEDTPEYVRTVVVPSIEQCRQLADCVAVTPGTRNIMAYPPPDDMGCFFSSSGTSTGRWGFVCMTPILYYGKDPYIAKQLGRRPNSYEQTLFHDANAIAHPCAKPLQTMLWLVERSSLPGQTALDPFMGSGTTGVACLQLGRSFIGIEIDHQYYRVAVQRISEALQQLPLFPLQTPAVQQPLLAVPKQKRTRR